MSFNTIPDAWIAIGKPVKQELFQTIKDDLDFLFSRPTSWDQQVAVVSASLDLTTQTNSYYYICDCTAGNIAITLPAAADSNSIIFAFKKIDSTANTLTINRLGSDTIEGATSFTVPKQYDCIAIVGSGSENKWYYHSRYNSKFVQSSTKTVLSDALDVTGALAAQGGLNVTGNIVISGTVDGVDVSSHAADSTIHNTLLTIKSMTDGYYSLLGHDHSGTYEPANSNIQNHISDSTIHNTLSTIKSMTDGYYSVLGHVHANDHSHANSSNLTSINQDLGSTSNPTFNSITVTSTVDGVDVSSFKSAYDNHVLEYGDGYRHHIHSNSTYLNNINQSLADNASVTFDGVTTDTITISGGTLYIENNTADATLVSIRNTGVGVASLTIEGTVTCENLVAQGNCKICNATSDTLKFFSTDDGYARISVSSPAAFNSTDGEISGLTFSASPTQGEVEALRDKCEELGDDCRALREVVNNLMTALKDYNLIG